MDKSFWNLLLNDETLFEYIAYAACVATVAAFVIQSVRILRTKNISGLSSYMYIMYSLALICWFTYGVYIECWPLAIANIITFVFTFIILLEILYYDEEDKLERSRRDPLTYVFNKKYYESYLPTVIQSNVQNKVPFSIFVAKIKNLDNIFAAMGGKYKNRAVKRTSKALEKALRNNDFVARIDDDLFAVYVNNVTNDVALSVINRVWNAVNGMEIKKSEYCKRYIDFRIGACTSEVSDNLADFTKHAEEALSSTSDKMPVVFYAEKKAVKSVAANTKKTQELKLTGKTKAKSEATKNKKTIEKKKKTTK